MVALPCEMQAALDGRHYNACSPRFRIMPTESERKVAAQRAEIIAFAQAALRTDAEEDVRRHALESIRSVTGATRVDLFLSRTEDEPLQLAAQLGPPHPAGLELAAASTSIAEEARRAGHTILRTAAADDSRNPLARAYRSALAVPVAAPKVHCVVAAFAEDREFDANDALAAEGMAVIFAAISARLTAERELGDRESMQQMILQQVPAVVWTTDRDLILTSLSGASLPEIRSRRTVEVGDSAVAAVQGAAAPVNAMKGALAGEPGSYTTEMAGLTFDAYVHPLRDRTGEIRGIVGAAFDVTARERARQELRASQQQLQRLSARMRAVEEEQRKRIAREIHDELGQRLTALSLELDLLRREIQPGTATRVAGIGAQIRELIDTVRRVASDLRPAILDDFGFNAAVESELQLLERRTGIAYDLHLPDEESALDGVFVSALFRIVQEALTNVVRHSAATHVLVALRLSAQTVELEIADNGRGIRPEEASGNSLGLLGIRERAAGLGGDADIAARACGGTRVLVRIPRSAPIV
jgi:two-component system sensor histidine kinase UhpB